MEGIQIMIKQKLHVAPPCVQGWDGVIGVGSLAYYVQDFSHMLIVTPMKEEFARKLVFMHGLNPWVRKIVYQKMDISDTNVKAYDDGGVHGG
jgi:hypothetical protein